MNSDFLWALAGTQFLFCMTSLGAALVFLCADRPRAAGQELLLGFSGGVMSAAAVWSLLLPAIEQAGAPSWLPAAAGLLLGAGFLALLDRVQAGAAGRERMLFTAITLHNIPEGMAVGVAYAGFLAGRGSITSAGALALATGIAIQNIPEGAIISMPLHAYGHSKGRAFLGGTLSGAVEPIFAALTLLLAELIIPAMPCLLSFAAGAMICVTARELIPEMMEDESSYIGVLCYALGFTVMMAMDVALG